MNQNIVLLLLSAVSFSYTYNILPGPSVKATKGEIWPKPLEQIKSNDYYILRPALFKFQITDNSCSLLENAISRYYKIITRSNSLERRGRFGEAIKKPLKKYWLNEEDYYKGFLDYLNVSFTGICDGNELPSYEMNENYTLDLSSINSAQLRSDSIWGILRGLETFSQLIHLGNDYVSLQINATTIADSPRFAHRGLLLDTSRHFIPLYAILQTIQAMEYNKLNVFHWHISDDHSFPYQSYTFPSLSDEGAYHPVSRIYTQEDVKHVIEYARQRGIRVVVEFDTPGHTRSWGVAYPELLTECYNTSSGIKNGYLGPIDPSNNFTYTFLKEFFQEIVNVFPDQYVHLGGDEVDFDCWESNPIITKFMNENNITDYSGLESYYVQKLIGIVDDLNASSIVWEEVFANGVLLPNYTVVHVWKGDYQEMLYNVTDAGQPALLSSCWYLDHLGGVGDWQNFYKCDPHNFNGTIEQKSLVLGGEACMWSEMVNENNVVSRVWPRASAAAEQLWSNIDLQSNEQIEEAAQRIEEHTCRLNARGIQAEPPNGPGVCL